MLASNYIYVVFIIKFTWFKCPSLESKKRLDKYLLGPNLTDPILDNRDELNDLPKSHSTFIFCDSKLRDISKEG